MVTVTAYHKTDAPLPRVVAQWCTSDDPAGVTNDWVAEFAKPRWFVFVSCINPKRIRFEHFSRFCFEATDYRGVLLASIEYDEQIAVKKFHLLREDEEEC